MDDLYDPDQFLLTFPLWFLAYPQAPRNGLIEVNGVGGEKGTPLFTDKDLADRFHNSDPGLKHYTLGMAPDPAKLAGLLDVLERYGFTHVTFDHYGRQARFHPIADLRSRLPG